MNTYIDEVFYSRTITKNKNDKNMYAQDNSTFIYSLITYEPDVDFSLLINIENEYKIKNKYQDLKKELKGSKIFKGGIDTIINDKNKYDFTINTLKFIKDHSKKANMIYINKTFIILEKYIDIFRSLLTNKLGINYEETKKVAFTLSKCIENYHLDELMRFTSIKRTFKEFRSFSKRLLKRSLIYDFNAPKYEIAKSSIRNVLKATDAIGNSKDRVSVPGYKVFNNEMIIEGIKYFGLYTNDIYIDHNPNYSPLEKEDIKLIKSDVSPGIRTSDYFVSIIKAIVHDITRSDLETKGNQKATVYSKWVYEKDEKTVEIFRLISQIIGRYTQNSFSTPYAAPMYIVSALTNSMLNGTSFMDEVAICMKREGLT